MKLQKVKFSVLLQKKMSKLQKKDMSWGQAINLSKNLHKDMTIRDEILLGMASPMLTTVDIGQ